MNFIASNSISSRLFVFFTAFSFVLLISLTLYYYHHSTIQLHKKLKEAAESNTIQAKEHMELLLRGYESLSKSIVTNIEIQRLLGKEEKNTSVSAINERTIYNAIGSIYYAWDDILGIYVVDVKGKIISYGSGFQIIDLQFAEREWHDRLFRSTGETVWLGIQQESLINKNERGAVFAFGRKINDLHHPNSIGMVLIEVKPQWVLNILQNMRVTNHTESYIVDGSQLMAHMDLERMKENKVLPNELSANTSAGVQSANGQMLVSTDINRTNWRLVSVVPESDLKLEEAESRKFLLIMGVLLLILSLGFAYAISKMVTTPIKKAISHMVHLKGGQLKTIPEMKSFMEIEIFIQQYNQMARRIDELIDNVKRVSESEKIAQIYALQSQVNPHFLYNTLDMIYWMLDEQEDNRLAELVLSLSNMFRYSSDWSSGTMTALSLEIEQIKRYALITELRFSSKITFKFNINVKHLPIAIPKMSLQPLVENAVIHGLEDCSYYGEIIVSTVETREGVHILIQDNGKGMEEQFVDKVNRLLQEERQQRTIDSKEMGSGILNVHRRLVYQFGKEYGIVFHASPVQGTIVEMKIKSDQ